MIFFAENTENVLKCIHSQIFSYFCKLNKSQLNKSHTSKLSRDFCSVSVHANKLVSPLCEEYFLY